MRVNALKTIYENSINTMFNYSLKMTDKFRCYQCEKDFISFDSCHQIIKLCLDYDKHKIKHKVQK
jgi:hypothetical protein